MENCRFAIAAPLAVFPNTKANLLQSPEDSTYTAKQKKQSIIAIQYFVEFFTVFPSVHSANCWWTGTIRVWHTESVSKTLGELVDCHGASRGDNTSLLKTLGDCSDIGAWTSNGEGLEVKPQLGGGKYISVLDLEIEKNNSVLVTWQMLSLQGQTVALQDPAWIVSLLK